MCNRASERFEVDTAVRCVFNGEQVDGKAYNLSLDGCMLDVPDLCLEAGDALSVCFIDDVMEEGEVVWSQAGFVGVRFLRPVHVAVVRLLRLTKAPVSIDKVKPVDRFGRGLPGLASGSYGLAGSSNESSETRQQG